REHLAHAPLRTGERCGDRMPAIENDGPIGVTRRTLRPRAVPALGTALLLRAPSSRLSRIPGAFAHGATNVTGGRAWQFCRLRPSIPTTPDCGQEMTCGQYAGRPSPSTRTRSSLDPTTASPTGRTR